MSISIVDAITTAAETIRDWANQKMATGLKVSEGKLYLTNDNGIIEDSVVDLPQGSGGGSGPSASITLINKLDSNTLIVANTEQANLVFEYASSETTTAAIVSIYVGGVLKKTDSIMPGVSTLNIGDIIGEGINEIKLTCTDIYSNSKSLSYIINFVSLKIISNFDDSQTYTGDINVRYTPYGAVEKTIHFIVDGTDRTVVTSETGKQQTFVIPAMYHGTHLLEIFAVATVNGVEVTSNKLEYDVMYKEDGATSPLISSVCTIESITQGELVNIPFTVYDPVNMTTQVTLTIKQNDEVFSESFRTVDRTRQIWSTRNYPVGQVFFIITYGNINKTHIVNVEKSDINISVKETDLEFQLKAAGKSNNDLDKNVWSSGNVTTIFENINWDSTGWVMDRNGDTALRLSGDAKATINFKPFETDARQTGRTIEMEFAIRDVNNRDAIAISCLSDGIGFTVSADTARITSEQTEISCNYTDEKKIRIAFVIEPRSEHRLMCVYLNGVLSGSKQYPENDNLQQQSRVNITVGSPYCSVDLYTMRSYNVALTEEEVRDNYISDITDVSEKLAVYEDNNIYDIYGGLSFSALQSKIPVLVITGSLPTYKGDKKSCVVTYTDPLNPFLDFEDTATIDIQGTSSQYYVRKNWKIKTSSPHILDVDQIPTKVLCWKVDYAEATGTHNTGNANYAHTLYGDAKTPPQEKDNRVRTTIYGRPCVIFHKETSSSTPVFYGKSNANVDKGGVEVFGFTDDYPNAQCVEFCNNVSDACLFHGPIPEKWDDDFEFRHPDKYNDISAFKTMHDWVVSTWQDGATGAKLYQPYVGIDGVSYSHDTAKYRLAKFKKEFTNYFKLDFCLIYYVYTFVMLMVDQRAKNMFLTTWDKVHWEPWLYDNDTCLGINNEGKLTFDYYHEDDDQLDGANVYNGATSTLWVNFRESFQDEIQSLYAEWRSLGLLSYAQIIEYLVTRQSDKWSISVYNEDSDFKYISMLRSDNDSTYLYQIRGTGEEHLYYFVKNRLSYCDAKWCCGDYPSNYVSLRIYTPMDENGNPRTDLVVSANPNITITPYSNTYAGVQFGAGSDIAQYKAKENTSIVLPWTMNGHPNDLETSVFPASEISSFGDLSPLYCGTVNVSKATKLKELIVGSGIDSYSNNNLTELSVGSNNLLQKIDVRNCPKLIDPLALANCPNIQEIYATGSGITGVELPNSGYLKKVYLPETLTNLTVTNQQYIEEFQLDGYDVLTTLNIENTVNIPVEDIMLHAPKLNRIRLIDVKWQAESEDALIQTIEKFKTCLGLDANGNNTDKAVVTGRVTVATKVSNQVLGDIYDNFPDLVVDDGSDEIYIVNYKDWDGSVLYTMRLSEGADAIDPIEEGLIDAPTRESDSNYSYEFTGWNNIPTNINKHYIVTAQYNTKVAVNFAVDGNIIHSEYVVYGENVKDPVENGIILPPTKEGTDDLHYVFNGWDGSLLNITIPRTLNAVFANVYPVRFYTMTESIIPYYVQWIKEGNDAYDPVQKGECSTPDDIITENEVKYSFSNWDNIPTNVIGICKVYAQYDTYWAVRFWNDDILHVVEWILEGSNAIEPSQYFSDYVDPVRDSTAQYHFRFNKWSGEWNDVFESRDFTAIYANILRSYNVYFYNDKELLQTVESVSYGSSTTYTGSIPVKIGVDNPDEYVFKGWMPAPENITGDTYCYALFKFTGYLFGKLGKTEEDDEGWGTVDVPNWNNINSYWSTISNDVVGYQNGLISEDNFMLKYPTGGRMIIPINLSSGTIIADVEIIGHNHDNLSDNSGKSPLTFFCVDLPQLVYRMNEEQTNKGGWEVSDMRTFINEELFNALPDELKTAIKQVNKISDGGADNKTLITTIDSCWLASYDEVGLTSSSGNLAGQGELYSAIFSNNKDSRKKYITDTTEAAGWWLRTSYYSLNSNSMFWRVTNSGGSYSDIAFNQFYVAFGFCI